MRYAIIDDGVIINVTLCVDADFAASQGWIALDDGFWIGDLWSAEVGFSHPDVTAF
jgi:hypothetical protein